MSATPLPPGSWLGMLGGGQLGRMFCMAAQSLGYRVAVLDPDAESPAGRVADRQITADYRDPAALAELAALCGSISTEFENVPADSLDTLARRTRVSPNARCVGIAQDRQIEKQALQAIGVPVAAHRVIREPSDLEQVDAGLFPGLLKTSRLGYDGKGQVSVNTAAELSAAWDSLERVPCVLEARLDLAAECSVVLARAFDGRTAVYPVAENVHRRGILHTSTLPAQAAALTPAVQQRAVAEALRIAEGLGYHGVLCVEFFVLANGQLLANEIAPRPHNSGHWTLDAAETSQFEQQARVMAGLPLGDTRMLQPCLMLNLLGDLWAQGEPDWARVLEIPGTHLHLYGKFEARPGRKMGHLNCTGSSAAEARQRAQAAAQVLNLEF